MSVLKCAVVYAANSEFEMGNASNLDWLGMKRSSSTGRDVVDSFNKVYVKIAI